MPELVEALVPLLVLGPLAVGSVCSLLPPAGARALTIASTAAWTGLVGWVTVVVARHGVLETGLGRWPRPVGIELRVDGLGAVLLLLTAVIGLAVIVAASGDEEAAGGRAFWSLWSFLASALAAVAVTADLFNAYVALELLTVVAVGMIALGGRPALLAALRYLLVAVLGSLAFLVAVALVYAEVGSLSIADTGAEASTAIVAAVAVGTAGLGIKLALWPLHGWLPPAHAAAPAAVSPLMSALVVKAALVVLVRLWVDVAGLDMPSAAFTLVGVLGTLGIVLGSIAAARQDDVKRVVACSTVAQVGYFAVALAMLGSGVAGPLVWQGLVLLVVGHGLAKAAMFLAAGSLARAHGGTELTAMRGAVTRQPMEVLTFGAAGVVLAGLPPSVAFAGKWQLVTAALASGAWWWLAVLLLGGLLTAVYVAVVLRVLLSDPEEDEASDAGKGDRDRPAADRGPLRWRLAALTLVLLAIGLGLRPIELIDLSLVGLSDGVVP